MRIEFLGHSEFLLEIENSSGRTVRILSDSWLTDFAFADFLQRQPLLEFRQESIPELDAIYLTHPHCDHFDPYTLYPLFQKQKPAILLPETAGYLKPLLEKYLGKPDIFLVKHNTPFRLFGLSMCGLSYPAPFHSNEDDVMMLFIENGKEALFYEADAAVPETIEAELRIHELFSSRDFESRIYIATRNELEALFTSYDAPNPNERKRRLKEYRKKRREEMDWEFEKHEEGIAPTPELWQLDNFLRILIGQGLVFPPELDQGFLDLSAPYTLSEVAADENQTAKTFKRNVQSIPHPPGKALTIEKGKVVKETGISWIDGVKKAPVRFLPDTKTERKSLEKPLRGRNVEREDAEELILNTLNQRFLPYWLTSLEEPVKQILNAIPERKYCIAVLYGEGAGETTVPYTFGYDSFLFQEDASWKGSPHEVYFAANIVDVLEGKQDLFSNTLDLTPENMVLRFWASLGLPFLTSDLIYKKLEFHFQRASEGKTVNDWFREVVPPHFGK